MQSGADVLVTGDLKYHTALDAREAGLCIIDAGHFNTISASLDTWLILWIHDFILFPLCENERHAIFQSYICSIFKNNSVKQFFESRLSLKEDYGILKT